MKDPVTAQSRRTYLRCKMRDYSQNMLINRTSEPERITKTRGRETSGRGFSHQRFLETWLRFRSTPSVLPANSRYRAFLRARIRVVLRGIRFLGLYASGVHRNTHQTMCFRQVLGSATKKNVARTTPLGSRTGYV
jgi:hypothetical protein